MTEYGLTDRGPNIKRLDVILAEMQESMTKKLGVNVGQNTQSFLNYGSSARRSTTRSTRPAQPASVWTTPLSSAALPVRCQRSPTTAYSAPAKTVQ